MITQSSGYEYYKLVNLRPSMHESSLIYVVRREGTPDLFGWS